MKKAFEELRLLAVVWLLNLATKITPKSRNESALLVYYIVSYLNHSAALGVKHAKTPTA